MTKADQARKELFEEVQSMYLSWSGRVLVQACTGAGKCKIALDLMKSDLEEGKCLDIIVPQDVIIKTWEREIIKWGYDQYEHLIDIYCNKSLHKNKLACNTIFDEAHKVTKLINTVMKPKTYTHKLIGLSATVDYNKMLLLNELGLGDHNSVFYPVDEAVEDEVVVPYKIKVISVPVDGINKKVEVKMKNGKSFFTTEQAQYDYFTKRIEELEKQVSIQELLDDLVADLKDQLKFARLNRMRCLYNFPSKQLAAQFVLQILPEDLKLIGFCGGIPQCNALFNHRYHSKSGKDDLKAFEADQFDRIGTVNAANMGINIPKLQAALVVQIQSKYIHLVQRAGRLLRHDEDDPNKVGTMYILVSRDTVDELEWVRKALEDNMDAARITYLTLEEIIADDSLLLN